MSVASRAFNHALTREQWARTRLATHAGLSFAVSVGPASTTLVITPDGMLAASDAPPALTLSVAPWNVPTLLAQPARWSEFVVTEGDASLGATLSELALTLPWFVEREFSRALGPIVGTRVADAGRALLGAPAYAMERLSESIARYAGDEAKLVLTRSEARGFSSDVASLADSTALLEARLTVLEGKADAA